MKIALYFDYNMLSDHSFHAIPQLKELFALKNITVDIYTPDNKKDKNNFLKSENAHSHIIWNIPEAKNYDVLLLNERYNKEWKNKNDFRETLAKKFIKYKKKVIVIKMDMTMEYKKIDNLKNIIYCIPSIFYIDMPYDWSIKKEKNLKYHVLPCFNHYGIHDKNMISKDDFYKKYNIDENYKIVVMLLGRADKHEMHKKYSKNNSNVKQNYDNLHYFYKHYDKIYKILQKLNYQPVIKGHFGEYKITNSKYIKETINIEQIDTSAVLQYASWAITGATTMVYQLYISELPVIDIGSGVYYPRHNKENIKLLKKYKRGKSLIYGWVKHPSILHNIEELHNFENQFIKCNENDIDNNSLKKKYKMKNNFKYYIDNPIYGNTYNTSLKKNIDDLITIIKK